MEPATAMSEVEAVLSGYDRSRESLIPILQKVQDRAGFLSEEAMARIAEYLDLSENDVFGVATFYAQFRFKPLGKNRITACRGTACHVRGVKQVIDEITKQLGIGDGETTNDLEFSLETVACIGSCALAPVMIVNDKVYGKSTSKRAKQILDELRGIAPTPEDEEEEEPEKPAAKKAAKKAGPKKQAGPKPGRARKKK